MKQQFVKAKNRKEVFEKYSWVEKVVKVSGGYLCFESYRDYETWKRQR